MLPRSDPHPSASTARRLPRCTPPQVRRLAAGRAECCACRVGRPVVGAACAVCAAAAWGLPAARSTCESCTCRPAEAFNEAWKTGEVQGVHELLAPGWLVSCLAGWLAAGGRFSVTGNSARPPVSARLPAPVCWPRPARLSAAMQPVAHVACCCLAQPHGEPGVWRQEGVSRGVGGHGQICVPGGRPRRLAAGSGQAGARGWSPRCQCRRAGLWASCSAAALLKRVLPHPHPIMQLYCAFLRSTGRCTLTSWTSR